MCDATDWRVATRCAVASVDRCTWKTTFVLPPRISARSSTKMLAVVPTRQHRRRMSSGRGVKQIRGVFEQSDLIIGVECLAQVAVHQQHVTADRQHTEWESSRLVVIRLQKCDLARLGRLSHPVLDLASQALDQRQQDRIRAASPAGEINNADEPLGYRVTDWRARTGELAQRPDEMLAATNERGPPGLERGADPVGTGEFLGVAVAGGQAHRIPVPSSRHLPRLNVPSLHRRPR